MAGDAARAAHALDEAAVHYTAALDQIDALPPSEAERWHGGLHFGRGFVWYQQADPRSGDELRRALAATQSWVAAPAELAVLDILASEMLFKWREALVTWACLDEGLALARRVGDRRAEVALQNRLTIALVNRLQLGLAQASGDAALASARQSGDELLVARAFDGLKLVAFVLGDYPALDRIVDEVARSSAGPATSSCICGSCWPKRSFAARPVTGTAPSTASTRPRRSTWRSTFVFS